ncbi:hypothetical protein Hanom_Chr03g00273441 [Helianthus anomalus]
MSGWFLVVAGDFSVPFLLLVVATGYLMSLNVWLVDRKQHQNNDSLVDLVDMHLNGKNGDCVGSDEEPNWLRNSFGVKRLKALKRRLRDIEVDLEHNVIVRGDGERLNDKELLVDEYESGYEKNGLCKRKGGGVCCGWSSSDDEDKEFKIYFCSRTHLQLSQFVK